MSFVLFDYMFIDLSVYRTYYVAALFFSLLLLLSAEERVNCWSAAQQHALTGLAL